MSFKFEQQGDSPDEVHEINVTPFIDVILVLLIIFMVAAPLSTADVAVDLPTTNATPAPRDDKPVFLTVKADGTLALGEAATSLATLADALTKTTEGNRQARIYLRADQSVSYRALMQVMNGLRSAGYLKVALVGLEGVEPK